MFVNFSLLISNLFEVFFFFFSFLLRLFRSYRSRTPVLEKLSDDASRLKIKMSTLALCVGWYVVAWIFQTHPRYDYFFNSSHCLRHVVKRSTQQQEDVHPSNELTESSNNTFNLSIIFHSCLWWFLDTRFELLKCILWTIAK